MQVITTSSQSLDEETRPTAMNYYPWRWIWCLVFDVSCTHIKQICQIHDSVSLNFHPTSVWRTSATQTELIVFVFVGASSTSSGPIYLRPPGFSHHAQEITRPRIKKKKKIIAVNNLDGTSMIRKREPAPPKHRQKRGKIYAHGNVELVNSIQRKVFFLQSILLINWLYCRHGHEADKIVMEYK